MPPLLPSSDRPAPPSPGGPVGPAREAPEGPGEQTLRAKEGAENFPVALRLLPAAVRADLRAVYDVVRTVDDLGDELEEPAPGARLAALAAFGEDLRRVWSTGAPESPVLRRLVPTVRRRGLPLDPFDRLVRANVMDQQVASYRTFDDLLAYCDLSATPIGELVLRIFGQETPERIALSDRICAGLQVVEHLQDVAEDRGKGRVYLPQDDLAASGVRAEDLDAATASPALRRVVLAELDRVEELLTAGRPLIASLSGWARLAVAGYVAGGRAAVDGVRRSGADVLAGSPGVRRRDVVRHLVAALAGARGAAPC